MWQYSGNRWVMENRIHQPVLFGRSTLVPASDSFLPPCSRTSGKNHSSYRHLWWHSRHQLGRNSRYFSDNLLVELHWQVWYALPTERTGWQASWREIFLCWRFLFLTFSRFSFRFFYFNEFHHLYSSFISRQTIRKLWTSSLSSFLWKWEFILIGSF